MTNKLFVGGISYNATDAQLEEHFKQAGTVLSAKIITDRDTGQGKGFGFVEMGTEEEARTAIQQLNNTSLEGRTINVNEAKPQAEKKPFQDRNRDQRGNFGSRSKRNNW